MPCASATMSKVTSSASGEAYAVLLDGNFKDQIQKNSSVGKQSRPCSLAWLAWFLLLFSLASGGLLVWHQCALRNLQHKVARLENQLAALAALDLEDLRSQLRDLDELRDFNSARFAGIPGHPTSADEDVGSHPGAETDSLEIQSRTTTLISELESGSDSDEDVDDDNESEETGIDAEDIDDSAENETVDPSRRKRQADLSSHTQDGIPIFDRGYGVSFNRTEGLRIYQSLLATGGRGEPRAPELPWDVTDSPIQPHHRQNSFWRGRKEKTRPYSTTTKTPLAPGDSQLNPQFDAVNEQYPRSTTYSPRPSSTPISVRASRVKPSKESATPSPVQGDQKSWAQSTPNVAEFDSRTSSAGIVPKPTRVRHHGNAAVLPQTVLKVSQPAGDLLSRDQAAVQATVDKEDSSLSPNQKLRIKKARLGKKQLRNIAHGITAVHLVADARNDSSNGIDTGVEIASRNELGLHTSWKMSGRQSAQGAASLIKLDGATVTIRQTGVYFVYAQVYYLDEHAVNAYEVFVNTEPFLRCVSTGPGSTGSPSPGTCYTGAVTVLREGDKLFVRDIEPMRYSLQQPSKTFFGLVRLAGIGH